MGLWFLSPRSEVDKDLVMGVSRLSSKCQVVYVKSLLQKMKGFVLCLVILYFIKTSFLKKKKKTLVISTYDWVNFSRQRSG